MSAVSENRDDFTPSDYDHPIFYVFIALILCPYLLFIFGVHEDNVIRDSVVIGVGIYAVKWIIIYIRGGRQWLQ